MRSADHDRAVVCKQDRRTVCGQNAKEQVRRIRHHGVSSWALIQRPGSICHNHVGGMDLVDSCKFSVREDRTNCKATITCNRFAIVAAAIADIETSHVADRDPAAPAKEAMGKLPEAYRADHLHLVHSFFRMMMSSSAWFPTMKS